MLTCLVSTNAKNIVEYDYDYVVIWFNKIQGNLRLKNLMEIIPIFALCTVYIQPQKSNSKNPSEISFFILNKTDNKC